MAGGIDGTTIEIIDRTSSTADGTSEAAPRRPRELGGWIGVVVTFLALALPPVAVADIEASPLRVPNRLTQWAADHHVGQPPEGVEVPGPTCGVGRDRHPLGATHAVRRCLRAALEAGESTVVHESFELSYPDAADIWTSLDERGGFRKIERWVSVEPPPDLETGVIAATDLRMVVTFWSETTCDSGATLDGDADSAFLECSGDGDGRSFRSRRPTTEAERDDLIARFVCTYDVFDGHDDC